MMEGLVRIAIFNQTCKFLIDTGSPYSIMSNQMYDKIQTKENLPRKVDHTRIRAADGFGWLVVLGLTALSDSISVYIGPSPKEREKEKRKDRGE